MKLKESDVFEMLEAGKSFYTNKEEDGNILTFMDGNLGIDLGDIFIFRPAVVPDEYVGISVDAVKLHELIKKIDSKEFKLLVKDDVLQIKKGSFLKGKIAKAADTSAACDEMLERVSKVKWIKLPEEFVEAIGLCSISMGRGTGTEFDFLTVDGEWIYSSDNMRISRYKLSKALSKKYFMMSGSIATKLAKFKLVKMAIDDSLLYFQTADGFSITAPRSNMQMLECASFFDYTGKLIKVSTRAMQAVDITKTMLDSEDDRLLAIEVHIGDGVLECKGSGAFGWLTANASYKELGKKLQREVTFKINPLFFVKVLSYSKRIKIGADRVGFKIGSFEHLIYLFRG